MLASAFGIFRVIYQDHILVPQHGLCLPKGGSNPLFILIAIGTLVVSIFIITGTSIYLRYKIIHSNRFYKSMKRSAAEEQKAVKVGRLVEILQEQIKPTFSVFIAGGIDAVFNVLIISMLFLEEVLFSALYT